MKLLIVLFSKIRILLKKRTVKKCKNTIILTDSIPVNVINNIGDHVYINKECCIYKDTVNIGSYTYINGGKIFYAQIGKFCSIGYNVVFGGGEHRTDTVTTYPVRARVCGDTTPYIDFPPQKDCIIGNGVWIGNNAHIMQGVKVGDGAIIGSNAVVTHDVPPYTVVAGVPATIIKTLCDQDTIDYYEKTKWWDWSIDKIEAAVKYGAFDSFEKYKEFTDNA